MSEEINELHKTILRLTAKQVALETLVLALLQQSQDKRAILKQFQLDAEVFSTKTIFDDEITDPPVDEMQTAHEQLLALMSKICPANES